MVSQIDFDRFGSSATSDAAVRLLCEQKSFNWIPIAAYVPGNDATNIEEVLVGFYHERFLVT